jgi:hypothetical protein
MSLCVAWKWQTKYCLATDSRIAGLGTESCDFGIKLLQLPFRVFTPEYNGKVEIIHESTLGLAFSGSYLSGFLTKERVAEVLFNLQFLGNKDDLTFDKIVNVISITFRHSMQALRSADMLWDTELLLIGTCPSSGCPKAYHVFPNNEGNTNAIEVLTKSDFDYLAIGTGSNYYQMLMDAALEDGPIRVHFKALELVRNTIQQTAEITVGGDVQYGDLADDGNFRLMGVMHYLGTDEQLTKVRASCRGVDIEELHQSNTSNDLFVRYSFIDPFKPYNAVK